MLFATTLDQFSLWLGSVLLLNSCRLFTLISQGHICEKARKRCTEQTWSGFHGASCLIFCGIFGVKNSGTLSADKILLSHLKRALSSWNAQPNLGERIQDCAPLLAISPLKHRFCSMLLRIVYEEKYYVYIHLTFMSLQLDLILHNPLLHWLLPLTLIQRYFLPSRCINFY